LDNQIRQSNKKRKIIESYDSSSYFYDERYGKIQERKYEILLNNYNLIQKTILDAGCGTGLLLDYINKKNLDKEYLRFNYVALDISWNMLLKFKLKFDKLGYKYNFSLILCDIENLPFRKSVFDLFISFTSFQNLPHIQKGFTESFKVCKNNADFRFSILKKKIDIKSLKDMIKLNVKEYIIVNKQDLEDFIIIGKVLHN